VKDSSRKTSLLEILRWQGFGSRRECLASLRKGKVSWATGTTDADPVTLAWTATEDPESLLDTQGLWLRVDGVALPALSALHIALHKPSGYECSRNPAVHASVLDLFPEPFIRRGLQPAGRLDADTTGLLILTDDGAFNHLLTSPKRKLQKTYQVGFKHPLTDAQVAMLEEGVVLRDDTEPTAPATVRLIEGDQDRHQHTAEITITEGRYHQVKRMGAAVGNRVESIHRTTVGGIELGALPPGAWRLLGPGEIEGVSGRSAP
jgi:16S rRNA pseudouridine516 synthase